MGNEIICKALDALHGSIDNSSLNDNEKNALDLLVDKLKVYFNGEINEIANMGNQAQAERRKNVLYSFMTDYLVAINDTIAGMNDTFSVVNRIYKEINYDYKKGKFKIKRLNKQ